MTTSGRIELMAPAGNFESMQAALDNGFEPNPNLGDDEQDDDDKEADALSWLQDRTQVIDFEGGVIIRSF
jgi:hypothetical protein